jgi:hypothetical protein
MSGISASPGLGIAGVRSRISEIQRRIGVSSTWAGGQAGQITPAGPGSSPDVSFQQALLQAGGRSAAGAGPGPALAPTPANVLGAGGEALGGATALLQDALGTTPVYDTYPAELPPVPVTDTMRAAGNGQLPDSLLSSIGQGEFRLAKPAADAFIRLVNAAKRDGVTFGVNDAYRSYAEQVDIAARKGIYGQGGLAAVPGTSNHGWGLATDLELDDRAQAWMEENAWRYGYFNDVPGESWHWTYRAS